MELGVIVARARNGVIGRQGTLPWRLPEDLAHFKQVTLGHPVIMGRRTWESLPQRFRPLPGRRNLVVTRREGWSSAGAEACVSLDEALQACSDAEQAWVIGGAQLYAQALPMAHRLEVTEIDADFDGDTVLPPWDACAFAEVSRQLHRAAAPNSFEFSFVTYRRRQE